MITKGYKMEYTIAKNGIEFDIIEDGDSIWFIDSNNDTLEWENTDSNWILINSMILTLTDNSLLQLTA